MKLHVYSIERWGIYGAEKNQQAPKCCGVSETLDALNQWAILSTALLNDTKTYDGNHLLLPSYAWGMTKGAHDDWLVSLWNEVENDDGKVRYAPLSEPVGDAKATSHDPGNDMIPGFPSLFWVLPKLNVLIAVVPETQRSSGVRQFDAYIRGFIDFFSEYVIKDANDPTIKIGLSATKRPKGIDTRVADPKLRVSYYVHVRRKLGHFEKILDSASNIRKVVKKLDMRTLSGRSKFRRGIYYFANRMNLPEGKVSELPRTTFKIEIPVNLERQDVQFAIDEYVKNDCSPAFDIGYVLKGEVNPIFLSGSKLVEEVEVLYPVRPDGTADLAALMIELQRERDTVKRWIS
ncbi:hypothetical protein [Aeromonas hydrophila]|uniref:hypothetical protein n=1 Tax=Aeromonas hydrophila TaxID=644 RepID=UPI0038CF894E